MSEEQLTLAFLVLVALAAVAAWFSFQPKREA